MFGWAIETSLDVEYAHSMAPGANILLVETPVAETLGVHGFPQIVEAENYVIDHHLGNVITQSFGAPEKGFPSAAVDHEPAQRVRERRRQRRHVLTGSGDAGPTGPNALDSHGFADSFFLSRTVAWPASDPLVTAVGGTQLHLNDRGRASAGHRLERHQPGVLACRQRWRPVRRVRPARPTRTASAASVGTQRGVPDISMSAAVDGAALVYLDAQGRGGPGGLLPRRRHQRGLPALRGRRRDRRPGRRPRARPAEPVPVPDAGAHDPGILDVTGGTNTVTFPQGPDIHTVKGFDAANGYDMAIRRRHDRRREVRP